MQQVLISILAFFITVSLIIGVHEFGHFIAARLLKIKVLRFSIGFGRRLFGFKDKKGTEYWVSAIPFGGYVKLLDENEGKVPNKELHLAFNRQPIYKRITVIIAGPLLNLVFAIFAFWLTFVIGYTSVKPVIGKVIPDSIAATAGLKANHVISAVDNKPTYDWASVILRIFFRVGDKGSMQISAHKFNYKKENNYQLWLTDWKINELQPNPLISLGIEPYQLPIQAIIGEVINNGINSKLRKGDKIVAIGNKKVKDWYDLVKQIKLLPDQTRIFKIQRDKKILNIPILIKHKRISLTKKMGFLGIAPKFIMPKNFLNDIQYSAWDALVHAYQRTVTFTQLNFVLIGKMIIGDFSLRSLAGPLAIFKGAGQAFYLGLIAFLNFLGFISATIGIFNLLPIPGLDGSQICYLLYEGITGKPVSLRFQVLAFKFGMIIILLIMFQAVLNDILRMF